MEKTIEQHQAEYATRPYAAVLRTSHASCTFRFNTLAEAIEYLTTQYERLRLECSRERYRAFDSYRSRLMLPGGAEVSVREFIGDSISSY